ncbi:uncharacterized protein LOC143511690 [Brachyhypopomus gauderio]|uniref:uncharacterized protein LOC143511690 n=1 Tax=Brachyhypopomus gauderio TaxID=698409 RepID=UPI0040417622
MIGHNRFSDVDGWNIFRLLVPDFGLFLSTFFILRLSNRLLRPRVQTSEQCDETSDIEDGEASDSEYEEESEGSFSDSSEESITPPAPPSQCVQKIMVLAAGLRLLLSTVINTAGKVVLAILLGLTGIYI